MTGGRIIHGGEGRQESQRAHGVSDALDSFRCLANVQEGGHGVPIFYSVKFLLIPKIFEPLLKGS